MILAHLEALVCSDNRDCPPLLLLLPRLHTFCKTGSVDPRYRKCLNNTCRGWGVPLLLGASPWRECESTGGDSIVRPAVFAPGRWAHFARHGVPDRRPLGGACGYVDRVCSILHPRQGAAPVPLPLPIPSARFRFRQMLAESRPGTTISPPW